MRSTTEALTVSIHARKHPTTEAEDGRARAYWKFHAEGQSHKVPREGVQPDHFYACSWCDRTQVQYECIPGTEVHLGGGSYTCKQRPVWDDREVEKFILPQGAASNPLAWVGGRLG